MASPVQIILRPENFEEARDVAGGGPNRDFFANDDQAFHDHKSALRRQLAMISNALASQLDTDVGYLKVILRREAWAKSHRPLQAIFKVKRTPLVGGGDIGEMIFQVTPKSMAEVDREIGQAEETTTLRPLGPTGRLVPHPSRRRSETGAIERIELFGPEDRRRFSLDQAITWLSDPLTGSSYHVELFDVPPPPNMLDAFDRSHRRLYQSFADGLRSLGAGLIVQRLATREGAQPRLAIRLEKSGEPPTLRLDAPRGEWRREVAPFDSNGARHQRLLSFLERHPLVRRIELPGVLVRSAAIERSRPTRADVPPRDSKRSYPRLGIIDGGVGASLADWVINRWGVLADDHVDPAHGTFIGGLLVAGAALNGPTVCPESDGAELADIAVFPREDQRDVFASYFPGGLPEFFDEVENAIAEARSRHGIRIFSMSLNVRQPVAPDVYSMYATRIDQIAETYDAIIFVSAGNLSSHEARPEWPADERRALANLAAARNDGILMPAESVRNVSVAAVNPPDAPPALAFTPARYSRRGPGLRAGAKPDLAHIGGSGSPQGPLGHGLFSINPVGAVTEGCGTSYATPLVAKTAAVLDTLIEGNVSRETLLGLLIHNSALPESLKGKAFAGLARYLVGHGIPLSATQMLEGGDHQVTLVVASRIRRDQQINFRFRWPACLVDKSGACCGVARLTLVATPPLDPRFGSEFVRVNVGAALQQEQPDGGWKGRLDPIYLPGKSEHPVFEAELIKHGLKWSPTKVYSRSIPRGIGTSSNWRLLVSYLTRAAEEMPDEGVPFTAILTIEDPHGVRPVFNDVRQTLNALGVQIADIRTAARVTARV